MILSSDWVYSLTENEYTKFEIFPLSFIRKGRLYVYEVENYLRNTKLYCETN